MSNTIVAKMAVEIAANTARFGPSIQRSQRDLVKFTDRVNKLAGALGIAFGTKIVADFAIQISKLAGEADGVQRAFDKLPGSVMLMERLKNATGDTVGELDLMKRAVQASNFDISLRALPELLEFAAVRAQQTGESVDYLVNSIVTGIGRKSKLILDNLGISAAQLDKALGGVSVSAASVGQVAEAVGKIASQNLDNMGRLTENAATTAQTLSASWQNLQVEMGKATSGPFKWVVEGLTNITKAASNVNAELALIATHFSPFHDLADVSEETLNYLLKTEQVSKALKPFITQSDVEFVERYNDNLDQFRQTLLSQGESLKDINRVWLHYVRIRAQAATQESEASSQKRRQAFKEYVQQVNTEGRDTIEALQKLARLREGVKALSETVTTKTGADFLFDTGALRELANSGANALRTLDHALEVNSNSMEVWLSGWLVRTELAAEALRKHQEQTMRLSETAQVVGSQLGDVFANIATGQEDLVRSMARATSQIIELFLRQSIAGMIASAMKDPSTPFPFAKIAVAAAGIAAVKTLFGQLGGSSSVGGSGSVPGRLPSETDQVSGRSRIHGNDLIIVMEKSGYRRSQMG